MHDPNARCRTRSQRDGLLPFSCERISLPSATPQQYGRRHFCSQIGVAHRKGTGFILTNLVADGIMPAIIPLV